MTDLSRDANAQYCQKLPGILLVEDPSYNLPRDPNLNLQALFNHFNKNYFDGKLREVTVEWNDELITTKGVFYYSEDNAAGSGIQLSVLLLQYNWQIYFALLHEMIHASIYFTVTDDLRAALTKKIISFREKGEAENVKEEQRKEDERKARVETYRETLVNEHDQPEFRSLVARIKSLSGMSLPQQTLYGGRMELSCTSTGHVACRSSSYKSLHGTIVHKIERCICKTDPMCLLGGGWD